MSSRRTGRFVVWMLAATVLLAACAGEGASGDRPGGQASGGGGDGTVKLRITWWGSQERHDKTMKALELYSERNPHVTFEPEYSGWDGYWDKLATQAAAKNAPDIIQMDAEYLADYGRRGQLAELTEVNTADMDESLLDTGRFEDKLLAVPLGNNAFGLIYNKAALDKLGVQLSPESWTWDRYFELAEQLKPQLGDGQYVIGDLTRDTGLYATYQLAKGKGHPTPVDGSFGYDRDTWLEYINKFNDLRSSGLVPPPDVTVSDKELDANGDLMVKGTILMRVGHAAQVTAWDSLMPGQIGMIAAPRAEEAGSWLKPSMFWSVSKDSRHAAEAQKFIDWFINDREAAEILGTSRGVPVSRTVLESLDAELTPADKIGIDAIQQIAEDAQTFSPGPGNLGNWNLFSKEMSTQLEQLLFDQTTPEEAWRVIEEAGRQAEQSVKG